VPFLVSTIQTPPHTVEVRAADVDADGVNELVFVSAKPKGRQPDAVSLTVVKLDAAGRERSRSVVELGQRALLWDIERGLWGVDGDGAVNLLTGARVGARRTALGGLGLTTPLPVDLAADIDHDGVAEVVVVGGGKVELFSADGRSRGVVSARAEGALRARGDRGGPAVEAAAAWPVVVIADADGDGRDELLLPDGKGVQVVRFTESGAQVSDLALPLDIDPRRDPAQDKKATRREIERVWFEDVNNDQKVDLVVHQWVVGGTFFGATAELLFCQGTGAGFAPPVTIQTPAAAVDVRLIDWDGDKDLDLVAPQVDLSFANLGRALVSRKVQVEVTVYRWGGAGFAPAGQVAGRYSWPLSEPESFHLKLEADLDGDGWLDLVTNEGEARVRAYRGGAGGVSTTPVAEHPGALPLGPSPIFVGELTGDKKAEVLLWGAKGGPATLLRLP
jgi:hypothetical protein